MSEANTIITMKKYNLVIKHILINNRKLIVACKIQENSIVQVVVMVQDRVGIHSSYHSRNKKGPAETHLVFEKKKQEKQYELVINWNDDFASTNWWLLPPIKDSKKVNNADIVIESEFDNLSFCFWITPSNSVMTGITQKVYPLVVNNQKDHIHQPWKNRIFSVLKCTKNEVDLEILETCCIAIKRDEFDLSKRHVDAFSHEIGVVNIKGEFELRRIMPSGIMHG